MYKNINKKDVYLPNTIMPVAGMTSEFAKVHESAVSALKEIFKKIYFSF